MNKYGVFEFISNIRNLIYTKCQFPKARLIRLPFYIRGKTSLDCGKGFTTGRACRFDLVGKQNRTLIIGKDVRIGDYVHIVAHKSIIIGDGCLLASKVFISDTNHGELRESDFDSNPLIPPAFRPLISQPVILCKNVWVGENVVILPGVTVGEGSILGANAVVNHDIPSFSIAVGSPARVIKRYNFEKSRWEKI